MREQTIRMIEQERIIAIVRGIKTDACMKVADALYEGGIRLMEITFNQKDPSSFALTAQAISAIGAKYKDTMLVGAGTVTTPELAEQAAQAGARFIISPDANPEVIRRTRELNMVSMPGAMTPTEILSAHHAGADFVKLFPVGSLGAAYVKAVRAPISHVKLMAVGGINEDNVAEFLRAGTCGAGVGGNLANKAWIEAGEFHKITQTARALLAAARSV
ncbi:MAG: bifunctional 4-hydroxy-2-oxoglutarate aldolase/2-dehydro-3-deoxy-phosphogluconate aldolase [Lawsonibacter sp.]|nr:bifunctional 4-hydroxy-2-oxoglutarate aldolase/2-dehydro-3-deoxy-phosphogluconate aldolase [Lawsonibacter sp.]